MAPERLSEEPIYDQRVNETLKHLLEGKTRDEIAKGFGLSGRKSLNTHMRRRGFVWDADEENYIPSMNVTRKINSSSLSTISIKAERIIEKFKSADADPRAIAKEMGFKDHKEMAKYMEGQGLVWDSEKDNYTEKGSGENNASQALTTEVESEGETAEDPGGNGASKGGSNLAQYLPLLQVLETNKDRLFNLIMPRATGHINKYAVPGVPRTKSFYMSDRLARLVGEFGEAKNLRQREIIEAAVVEYLRRYGYQREVDGLLLKK